jgi:hypothetical protein
MCGGVGIFAWKITIAPLIQYLPAASRYRAVQGRVVETRLDKVSTSGSTNYEAAVVYLYAVDGHDFRGARISFAEPLATPKADQLPILEHYPVGATVEVYYDPRDPRQAVLDLAIMKYQLYFDFFMVPFVLTCLLLVACTAKAWQGDTWAWSRRATLVAVWFMVAHIVSTIVLGLAGALQPDRSWLVIYGIGADLAAIALALLIIRPNSNEQIRATAV